MKIQGKVHKYGDHVDTDVIIPARYLNTAKPEELAAHCMEDIDKDLGICEDDGLDKLAMNLSQAERERRERGEG